MAKSYRSRVDRYNHYRRLAIKRRVARLTAMLYDRANVAVMQQRELSSKHLPLRHPQRCNDSEDDPFFDFDYIC